MAAAGHPLGDADEQEVGEDGEEEPPDVELGNRADVQPVGDETELNVWGFVFAVLAALLLIGVAEGVAGGRDRAVR